MIIVLGIHNSAKKSEILGDWVATGQHRRRYLRQGATSTRASLGNGASQFPLTADDEIAVKKFSKSTARFLALTLRA